jgi:hypothetical protein
VGHTSKSSGLLCLEASRARVFQFDLKIDGGAARMVHVASSWRSRADETENRQVDAMGYVGPCYPYFEIFIVLGPRGIVVF